MVLFLKIKRRFSENKKYSSFKKQGSCSSTTLFPKKTEKF